MAFPSILKFLPFLSKLKKKKRVIVDEQQNDDFGDGVDASVDGTVKRLFVNFERTDTDTKQCIIDFFENHPPEYLRKKIMELITKIKESTNNDKKFIHGNSSNIIHQILVELEAYIATKDVQFKVDFIYGKVTNELYSDCFKIVVKQDITECTVAVDLLFSLRNPESRARFITICINVKTLLEKEKTRGNENIWTKTFGIDIKKYNDKKGSYVDAIDDLWPELVRYTAAQIKALYPNFSTEECAKLIIEFFQKCEEKPMKTSTMELMCKVVEELKGKNRDIIHEILLQIVLQFEICWNGKDEAFVNNDVHRYVPEQFRKSCFEIAKSLDITKCSSALDLFFCISNPESAYREVFVADFVKKLLGSEKSLNQKNLLDPQKLLYQKKAFFNGVKWAFIFDIKYVKTMEFKNIVYNTFIYQMENDVLPIILNSEKNWYLWVLKNSLVHAESNKFDSELEENFVKFITVERLRSLVEAQDCTDASPRYTHEAEMECYEKRKDAGQKENKYSKRELDRALLLLDKKETYKDAIKIFCDFTFAELDFKYAEKIVYKSLIYSNGKTVPNDILKTTEDKIHFLFILEEFFENAVKKNLQSDEEKDLRKLYTLDDLPYLVPKFAEKYKLEVHVKNFFAYESLFMLRMQKIYVHWSHNIFGFCYMHAMESCDSEREILLQRIFAQDLEYVHSWTCYLTAFRRYTCFKLILESKIDEFVLQVEEVSREPGVTIEKFPIFLQNKDDFKSSPLPLGWRGKLYIDRDVHPFCANEDSIIECTFQDKHYNFITVKSPEAFNSFIDEHLCKAKFVSIDIETGRPKDLATVLQLKADDWLCLIDVQELLKNENTLWKKIFEQLFDPSIIRKGFAFSNDFKYLAFTFPWSKELLQKNDSKVFCLQHLVNEILAMPELNGFFSKDIKKNCSLAKLSKEVMNYKMDKMEQNSDWTKRPLTPFQKIYAVLDALFLGLISDKIKLRLQERLGDENVVEEIMKKGYICFVLE